MAAHKMVYFIRRAEEFHKRLKAFYAKRSEEAQRGEVKLLLQYMSRHEAFLEQWLKDYEQTANNGVLEEWLPV